MYYDQRFLVPLNKSYLYKWYLQNRTNASFLIRQIFLDTCAKVYAIHRRRKHFRYHKNILDIVFVHNKYQLRNENV